MRIISGTARGRRLVSLTGRGIRPTPDRVREALFSILQHRFADFDGKRVLDLFAGSGALALEALSRGAASACLVDRNSQAARAISDNIRACGMADRATFIQAEVGACLSRLAAKGGFDLIFLDPPYHQGLILPTLEAIDRHRLLTANGLICGESARDDDVPTSVDGLEKIFERVFGSTVIHLFGPRPQEAGPP